MSDSREYFVLDWYDSDNDVPHPEMTKRYLAMVKARTEKHYNIRLSQFKRRRDEEAKQSLPSHVSPSAVCRIYSADVV